MLGSWQDSQPQTRQFQPVNPRVASIAQDSACAPGTDSLFSQGIHDSTGMSALPRQGNVNYTPQLSDARHATSSQPDVVSTSPRRTGAEGREAFNPYSWSAS
ncbi:uncharacterized protein PADG_02418 [Paracoccidioides brasiliensis Pb18]|uniref:Uncharacterized protein n=1 Tax=Paracoccidioides brasiliensis (strain Pb18) TaxID=502780 RepID=C1G5G3_PARBD|nr:uncharacterized protein PADG_02418 [Paracoccidioides brasiliensis Pb18]EEH46320.2 hypothetical protein PADG_02418 [Paracoccidioides brasiliensis Pb18]